MVTRPHFLWTFLLIIMTNAVNAGPAAPTAPTAAAAPTAPPAAAPAAPTAAAAPAAPATRSNAGQGATDWFNDFSTKNVIMGSFVHRIAIITGFKGGVAEFMQFDDADFGQGSFFELVDSRELDTNYLLNRKPTGEFALKKKEFSTIEPYAAALFASTFTDTIIYAPPNDQWTIYFNRPGKGAEKIGAEKGPQQNDPETIKKWLLTIVGYSGIVLDHKDSKLLVAIYKPLQANGNALLTNNTVNKLVVDKTHTVGAALLKNIECHESLCIFEALIDASSKIEMGDKIIF